MEPSLLFRKKQAMSADGLDWLRGSDAYPYPAKRNTTGSANVSAILVRALLAALEGQVLQILHQPGSDELAAQVSSKSAPGTAGWCWHCAADGWRLPHGEPQKATYHLGVLFIAEALANPAQAQDFWAAYATLLDAYAYFGKAKDIAPALVKAADELYYLGRYLDQPVASVHDRLPKIQIGDALGALAPTLSDGLKLAPLTDATEARQLLRKKAVAPTPKPVAESGMVAAAGFCGWQLPVLRDALQQGWNVLLAGPTGTGKTIAVQEAVLSSAAALVTLEGKEGLTELDFLGAILPQPDGTRRWVDGPLLRALRQAQYDPVVLFMDEVNRVPTHHQNLLLGLMNPKPATLCLRQGIPVEGPGPFYVIEVPLTSEIVWCPVAHLRLVAAGNFGSDHAVHPMDPAVRRRFDMVLDFDYLPLEQELALVQARTALDTAVAKALCLVAQYTRQMRRNGDLPGCVDTASLLNWARLCAQQRANTAYAIMHLGLWVFADIACGRDHVGLVRQAKFEGLTDYLLSQSVLPPGDAPKR